MRIYEIVCPGLFLHSASKQQIGATISLSGGADLCSGIEDKLEATRPTDKLSRKASYPLYKMPKSGNFIYRVEAPKYDRFHSGWLKLMTELETLQCEELDIYAVRYWSGDECKEAPEEPWEYRADSVKIVQQVPRKAPMSTPLQLGAAMVDQRWHRSPSPSH